MPQVYTVELDGKQYDIEGDRPPTEAEARAAVQSFTPPEQPSALSRFGSGFGEGVYNSTIGALEHPIDTLSGMGILGPAKQMQSMYETGKGLLSGLQENTAGTLGNVAGTAATGLLIGKAAPKVIRGVARVPGAMADAGAMMQTAGEQMGQQPTLTRMAAGAVTGSQTGGAQGAAMGAVTAAATPPILRGVGRMMSKAGQVLSGPSKAALEVPAPEAPVTPVPVTPEPVKPVASHTPSPIEEQLRASLAARLGSPAETPAAQLRKLLADRRTVLGSRDAARELGLPQELIRKLAPMESNLPQKARAAIDARMKGMKREQMQAYLDVAPNELARVYIQSKMGL